jgi:hypothetical protein
LKSQHRRPILSGVTRKLWVILLLASWVLLAAGSVVAAHAERCLSCPDCADGGCDDEGGDLGSHDHCCLSSCWSHTAWLLPAGLSASGSNSGSGAPICPPEPDLLQHPSSVFHPPRS